MKTEKSEVPVKLKYTVVQPGSPSSGDRDYLAAFSQVEFLDLGGHLNVPLGFIIILHPSLVLKYLGLDFKTC